jgi:hypothetical protein
MLAGWLAPRIGGLPPAPPLVRGRLRPPTPPPKGIDLLEVNVPNVPILLPDLYGRAFRAQTPPTVYQ